MIQLEEKFDGHIILYCKSHYQVKDVDFILGLQRIWAVRCALPFDSIRGSFNEYLADKMHEIFAKCAPNKLPYFHQIMNKGLCNEWQYEGLSAIERVIMIYRNELMQLQVKESKNEKFKTLIKLPKPQKRIFRGIVSGNEKYNDYRLVK